VESAVHRREDERGGERRDEETDASLVVKCAQRGDQRCRDV
jgi:hypothetical protein